MQRFARYIELFANVAIIVVAILLCFTLGKRFLVPSAQLSQPNEIQAGSSVSLPNFDWSKSNKTLLLVLQKDCHFCTESAPFYRTLVASISGKPVKLLAVLPQEESVGREYLHSMGVQIEDVRQGSLGSLNVRGTPTVVLINDKGKVIKSWVGKLSTEREKEVLSFL